MTQPSDEQLADLARLIGATENEEIDCAEMLNLAAGYLKAIRMHSATSDQFRQAAQHLAVCPECHEEFRALILAEGLDPNEILHG